MSGVDVLASSEAFCAIVGQATRWDVRGAWHGSAFRNHPHGLIVDGIKFTDHHHVDRACSIEITDGDGWSRDFCRDPAAQGNPHPQPIAGQAICVWRNGRWVKEEYRVALEAKVLAILADASAQLVTARNVYEQTQQRKREAQQARYAAAESAALARAVQVSA